ncbi:Bacterial alpha-L-rhamnosidase, partial [Candidatus Poribacteria bacterium]|nr:Bacterial alpha-L-rhamnosidase [Candidatus Poribacteria bacterium]
SISCVVDTQVKLEPIAPVTKNKGFSTFGPFDSSDEPDFAEVWNAKSAEDLEKLSKYAKKVKIQDEYSTQIFDLIASAEEVPGQPVIEDMDALCSANEDVTIIHPSPDGSDIELVLDFGRMGVGFLEFEIEGQSDVIMDWLGFESIQEGEYDYAWGMNNVMRYVTRSGYQKFHSVIRRGGRYFLLAIRNLSAPMKIRQVKSLLNTYPVIQRGEFICNDHTLNQVWDIGSYTTRLCSEDTFVDCPTYEQTFWVGDSRNEGAVNYAAFGEYALSRHCLILAGQSLERSPVVESQVPSAWENILTAWSLLWALACEEYYQMTGEMEFVREIYPYMEKQARNFEDMLDTDRLLSIEAWNMLDWAPMDTPGAGIITHQNAWLVEAYRRTARMAQLIGKDDDARHFMEVAEKVKSGINKHLWDDEKQAYIDCIRADGTRSPVVSQQTNTVIFLCDCATEERKEIIKGYIADAPEGFVKVGSPFMMFFTFEALAKMGKFQDILDISRDRWGFMLDQDATTCWETFPGFSSGGRWTRSHCHAWSSAPTYFLSTYQLGVMPLEPGFAKALIAPIPVDLQWARGRMPTPEGNIAVSWKKGDEFEMEVCLPAEVYARIVLPVSVKEYPNLDVETNVKAKKTREDDCWVVEVDAGAFVKLVAST